MSNAALLFAQQEGRDKEKSMAEQLRPSNDAERALCEIVKMETSSITLLRGDHAIGKSTRIPALIQEAVSKLSYPKCLVAQANPHSMRMNASWLSSSGKAKFADGRLAGKVNIISNEQEFSKTTAHVISYTTDELLAHRLTQFSDCLKSFSVVFLDDVDYHSAHLHSILLRIKDIIKTRDEVNKHIHFILMKSTSYSNAMRNFFAVQSNEIIDIPSLPYLLSKPQLKLRYLNATEEISSLEDVFLHIETCLAMEAQRFTDSQSARKPGVVVFMVNEDAVVKAVSYFVKQSQEFRLFSLLPSSTVNSFQEIVNCTDTKIIFTTNSAMWGLTLTQIEVVFTVPQKEVMRFDARLGINSPQLIALTQAELMQQQWRAGRFNAGAICYHILTKDKYDILDESSCSDLAEVENDDYILRLYQVFPGQYPIKGSMELLEYPHPYNVKLATRKFRMAKLIQRDGTGYRLTKSGQDALSIPAADYATRQYLSMMPNAMSRDGKVFMIHVALTIAFRNHRLVCLAGGSTSPLARGLVGINPLEGDFMLLAALLSDTFITSFAEAQGRYPKLTFDEGIHAHISNLRRRLLLHFNMSPTTKFANPQASEQTDAVFPLLDVFQWQLLDIREWQNFESWFSEEILDFQKEPTEPTKELKADLHTGIYISAHFDAEEKVYRVDLLHGITSAIFDAWLSRQGMEAGQLRRFLQEM